MTFTNVFQWQTGWDLGKGKNQIHINVIYIKQKILEEDEMKKWFE